MGTRKRVKRWLQRAFKRSSEKPGLLHRQLKVPKNTRIPRTLLGAIKKAEIGETIKNPTKTGKKKVKVTRLLKRRAVLVHTAGTFKRGKK